MSENKKTMHVSLKLTEYYEATIEVPEDISLEEAIAFAKDNINNIPTDEVVAEDLTINEDQCWF